MVKVIIALLLLCTIYSSTAQLTTDNIDLLTHALKQATPQQIQQIQFELGDVPLPTTSSLQDTFEPINCTMTPVCFDNTKICRNVCAHDSVYISDWYKYAYTTQRNLKADIPINQGMLYCSHNSLVTYADGFGVYDEALTKLLSIVFPHTTFISANQQLSFTDQLNLGLRMIEIDVHWLDSAKQLKICHAGGVHLKFLNQFVSTISKILHIPIDWDSETLGCFDNKSRSLDQSLDELKAWLERPENAQEIVILMFDDQMDLETWNKVPILVKSITDRWTVDQLFTPVDKIKLYPDSNTQMNNWPTPNQLIQLKKRVIFTSRSNYGATESNVVFYKYGHTFDNITDLNFGNWTEFDPINFTPYPACTLKDGGTMMKTNEGYMIRVIADSLVYSKFFNGPKNGEITTSNIHQFIECNTLWACADQVTPTMMEHAIWSWDVNQPSDKSSCVAMNSNGRWASTPCTTLLPFACQSTTDGSWILSLEASVYEKSMCPPGYIFAAPVDGLSNRRLSDVLTSKVPAVWIHYEMEK